MTIQFAPFHLLAYDKKQKMELTYEGPLVNAEEAAIARVAAEFVYEEETLANPMKKAFKRTPTIILTRLDTNEVIFDSRKRKKHA